MNTDYNIAFANISYLDCINGKDLEIILRLDTDIIINVTVPLTL